MRSAAPPQPPGMAVLGHTLRWVRDPFTIGSWANEAVGGVATLDLLGEELVLVTDPDPIEEVLVDERSSFPKSAQYEVAFGPGLASVSGEEWQRQRDVISRFFRSDRVDGYAEEAVSLAASHTGSWRDGAAVPLYEEMKALTLRVLFETVFDYRIEPRGEDGDVLEAVEDLGEWF